MLCPECQETRKESDFLMGNQICYKCVYAKKLASLRTRTKKCKICKKECEKNRWVYCSKACAEIGEAQQNKVYWATSLKVID